MWADAIWTALVSASGNTSGSGRRREDSNPKGTAPQSTCCARPTTTGSDRSPSAWPTSPASAWWCAAMPDVPRWRSAMRSSAVATSTLDAFLYPVTRPQSCSRQSSQSSRNPGGTTRRRWSGHWLPGSATRRCPAGLTWRGWPALRASDGDPRSKLPGGNRTTRRVGGFAALVKSCRSAGYYAVRTSAFIAQKCIRCTDLRPESAFNALGHRGGNRDK